jgi:hypothetical protein
MNNPGVGVVIPILNRRDDTLECLTSLYSSGYSPIQVYIVDNGSTDGSSQVIASRFPHVTILRLESNRGFSQASNIGIRQALASGMEYILLLNNDTIVDPNMIEELVKAADILSKAGILAPQIMHYGQELVWSSGSQINPLTLDLPDFSHSAKLSPISKMKKVDAVVGCGMLIRQNVFNKIGLLDESFFFYFEDLDFCLRARDAGYEIWTIPQAQMWHKVSASTEGHKHIRFYHLARSGIRFYFKYSKGLSRYTVIAYRIASACKFFLRRGVRGDFEGIRSYYQGLLDGLKDINTSSV